MPSQLHSLRRLSNRTNMRKRNVPGVSGSRGHLVVWTVESIWVSARAHVRGVPEAHLVAARLGGQINAQILA